MSEMEFRTLIYLIAFMALLVLALRMLSEAIQNFCSPFLKWSLESLNKNVFLCFGLGKSISFYVQSATTTSLMAMSYAQSGLLSLEQLFAVLVGANVGITLTPFLILLSHPGIEFYFIGLSFIPLFYCKNEWICAVGKFLFAIGLIFLCRNTFVQHFSNELIENYILFQSILPSFNGVFLHYMAGVLFFASLAYLIQSRLALLFLAITLVQSSFMSVEQGLLFVIGLHLGSSLIPVVLIGTRSIKALRGALAHFMAHLVVVVMIFFVFDPLAQTIWTLIDQLDAAQDKNILAVSLFVPVATWFYATVFALFCFVFYKVFLALSCLVVRDAKIKERQKLEFIGSIRQLAPELALEQVSSEVKKMSAMVQTILHLTAKYLANSQSADTDKALKYANITDNINKEVHIFSNKVMEVRLTAQQSQELRKWIQVSTELENIADQCKLIICSCQENQELRVEQAHHFLPDFNKMLNYYNEVFECLAMGHKSPKELDQKLMDLDFSVGLQHGLRKIQGSLQNMSRIIQ